MGSQWARFRKCLIGKRAGSRVARCSIFSNPKSQFGQIMEGLRLEDVEIFYGHLEYFRAIWYILWPFGKVVVIWYVYFTPVLAYCVKKNLATLAGSW
jgi:hypothetical protein